MEHPHALHRLPVRFVGSGSEYFRIWIVNLLLILVTLGLYYPFAKVRKLRYFHGATEVGGHPLGFHADPWKMLRGYLLVGAMVALYSVAGQFSPTAGAIAFVIVAAIWPALWHSSLRFRLANTGWRGLRFRFTGGRAGAYKVMLPWLAIGLLFIVVGFVFAPEAGEAPPVPPAPGSPPGPTQTTEPDPGDFVFMLLPLLLLLAFPALLWLLRRYQHDHYALGAERSAFTTRLGSFYGVFAIAALMMLGIVAVLGVVAALVMPALFGELRRGAGLGSLVLVFLLVALAYMVVLALVGAYVGARLQNLVWNGTRSQHIGFASRLGVGALARLSVKNWVLIVLTLGLYLPFAAVAMARLKLEAVELEFGLDPDALVAVSSHLDESAAGDAAGDLFGFDIGL